MTKCTLEYFTDMVGDRDEEEHDTTPHLTFMLSYQGSCTKAENFFLRTFLTSLKRAEKSSPI